MKTLKDITLLIAVAMNSCNEQPTWFFNFSGHVSKLEIRYYPFGWSLLEPNDIIDSLDIKLNDEDSIQSAYWFIKSKLK